MIQLDLSILNQKGTPMFNSDIFANRPAAGIAGRIFISTDTLTIYRDTGTTWDTIGGGGGTIAGTIAAGQVAFGTAANTIGGENNFFWDATNDRLGIGTNIPSTTIDIRSSALTIANIRGGSLINQGSAYYVQNSSGITLGAFGDESAIASGTPDLAAMIYAGSSVPLKFYTGGSTKMTLFSTGNLAIGTTTDGGQRLQVIGDTLLRGSGASAATTALTMQNSSSTNLYRVFNDGVVAGGYVNYVGQNSSNPLTFAFENGTFTSPGAAGRNFGYFNSNTNQTGDQYHFALSGNTITATSGTHVGIYYSRTFAPTSGNGIFSATNIAPIINQVGATGITRGLYVNPTLTAAADWRSIEWTNNSGWGLYGVGTAPSYFAGNVQIGSTTAIGSTINLQVTGIAHILDTRTYTSGTIQSFVVQKNTTINSVISGSSGICNYVSTGDNGISSSQSVPASTTFANIYAFNKYQFNSAGLTLTQTQGSPGVRSISQLFTQNVFKGANNGTITHMSGIQIGGYYNDNTGTITPVITNAYQLLINDTGAYGHTFTLTNRWGIYQEGINDRNYLAGNLLLNSTTDTGQILQVNGAIRVNGQASATAGGNSGQHLIINVDGTQYKINLLNP